MKAASIRICCFALFSILAVAPSILEAQDTDNRSAPVFLERSYISTRAPRNDLLFEAQLAPHLFLHQGFYQEMGRVFEKPTVATAFSFTPMVRLRMLSTNSFPVRTPSYMPKLNFQFFRARAVDASRRLNSPIGVFAINTVLWGHHSNGQEGCLFSDQVDTPDGCVDTGPTADQREVNRTDGSFSTNYFRVGVAYRNMQLDDSLVADESCTYAGSVELHPEGFGPGAISPAQAALYPQVQVRGALELSRRAGEGSWRSGRTTGSVQLDYLPGRAYDLSKWAVAAELSHTLERVGGWGVFVRYYGGMDYYNLGFLDDVRYVQAGLVFDAGRSDEFALNPSEPPPAGKAGHPNWLDRICGAVLD
jgi:hypothetical protein